MIELPASALAPYPRYSLYNSPYRAHAAGRAIDLYPAPLGAASPEAGVRGAPSPVAGTVREVISVAPPARSYAEPTDHLVLIDVDLAASDLGVHAAPADRVADDLVARVLHVDPAVDPGDRVAVGDPLGDLLRSGLFAPWVDEHLHLELRPSDRNLQRASGSLALGVEGSPRPLDWDGRGAVVSAGETYAVLDAPAHSGSGRRFAGLAAAVDAGKSAVEDAVLDGGLRHYAGGGAHPPPDAGPWPNPGPEPEPGAISLLGRRVGTADGRDVAWAPVDVLADGEPIVGLSLFLDRQRGGVKLIAPDRDLRVGDRIAVTIRPSDDPVRLGPGR